MQRKLSINLDYRVVSLLLVVALAGTLLAWRPWSTPAKSDRTIKVSGQATVSAVPDEYVFSPTYQFTNSNKEAALAELTAKSNEIVAKLKELKVPSNKIKTSSTNYDARYYGAETTEPTYNLSLTVTVSNEDIAQKVQDYLVGTSPSGQITPQVNFSTQKRLELESEARAKATKDARTKAEESAANLGFKLGKVKAVDDGTGFGGAIPLDARQSIGAAEMTTDSSKSLSLQIGENELSYMVNVTYYLK
jgi:uncharacterized protein YggE